jgi:DNA-binding MarR family transcriptional regulator
LSDENGSADEKLSLRLWLGLLRSTRLIENEIRSQLREQYGMTLPRFDVMAQLYRDENRGLRMGELSEHLVVTGGNITGIVEQLVEDGWVERLPDPKDRRAFVVRLTPTGLERFSAMADEHRKWIVELLNGLDPDEQQDLTKLLLKLREPFKHPHDPEPQVE